jgi:hypothetical protein
LPDTVIIAFQTAYCKIPEVSEMTFTAVENSQTAARSRNKRDRACFPHRVLESYRVIKTENGSDFGRQYRRTTAFFACRSYNYFNYFDYFDSVFQNLKVY